MDDAWSAIRTLKPTAIIGVSAVGGTFTPEVVQTRWRECNERPIVFALSNPTSKAECSAEEAYHHTGGRALFACGSPDDPVRLDGRTYVPRQGNNSYIFPGVGLGVVASGTRLVTDEMFMAAAHTLGEFREREEDLKQGSLYPALPRIREVSAHIAAERLLRSLTSAVLRPGKRRTTCSPTSSRKCMILTIDVSKVGIRRSELHIVVVGGSADAMTPRLFDRGRKLIRPITE